MRKSIKRLFEFSLGPIISSIIGFITIPLITYLISPGEYGKVSMFTLMQTILTLTAYLGMDQAYSRFYNEYKDKNKVLYNSIFFPLIISIILIFVTCINSSKISYILFESKIYETAIYLLAISVPFIIIERFILLSTRMEEKAKLYSILITLTKLTIFVLTIVYIIFIRKDFLSIVYAQEIGQIINGIILLIVFRKKISFNINLFDKNLFKKIFKFGLPLLFVSIITWGLNSTDKIFLRIFSNFEELGFYNIALKISNLLLIIQTCFTTYWIPMAYRWKKEEVENDKFENIINIVSFIMVILFMIIVLFKNLLIIVVSDNYKNSINILPFLLIYPVIYCISETTGLGIAFSNKSYLSLISSTITIIINILLNCIFIPRFGALGAGISTGISYTIFFWIKTMISRKLWYNFETRKLVCITILMLLSCSFNIIIKNEICIYIINILMILGVAVLYKKQINKIKNNIFSKKDAQLL